MSKTSKYGSRAPDATVRQSVLTDNSSVWDVIYVDPNTADKLTFGCMDSKHAAALASLLNDVSAIEIDQVAA